MPHGLAEMLKESVFQITVVIHQCIILMQKNKTKQAQRRAAADQSRHKSHGVIQY